MKQTKTAVPKRIHVGPGRHGRGNLHPVTTIDRDR
jgi:hypothetical protein